MRSLHLNYIEWYGWAVLQFSQSPILSDHVLLDSSYMEGKKTDIKSSYLKTVDVI